MIESDLAIIMTVEIIRVIFGFGLLILDFKILLPTIKKSSTFYLFGILVFNNLMYLSRAYGIISDQVTIRQNLPALSGFGVAILLVVWSGSATDLDKRLKYFFYAMIILSSSLYLTGQILTNNILIALGLILFMSVLIATIIRMFNFVFKKSPYIKARKRMFLMALAIIIMIIFEGAGVLFFKIDKVYLASFFFLSELLARLLMTVSIILPEKLQDMMEKIIS